METEIGGSSLLLMVPFATALAVSRSVAWKIVVGAQMVASFAYNSNHTDAGYVTDLFSIFMVGYVYMATTLSSSSPLRQAVLGAMELLLLVSAFRSTMGPPPASPTDDARFAWIRTPSSLSFLFALLLVMYRAWTIGPSLWVPLLAFGTIGPIVWWQRLRMFHGADLRHYSTMTYIWHACVAGILTVASFTI